MPRQPFLIGVFGDSIAFGAGVDARDSWPRQLEVQLRRTFGRGAVRVVNGAVRASSADFAALCWNEIWGPEWRAPNGAGRTPPIQLAIIDYAFTSSPKQLNALIDRCTSRKIPVLATLHCPHADWHVAWQSQAITSGEWRGPLANEWHGPGELPARVRHAADRMTRFDYSARRYLSKRDATRAAAQLNVLRQERWALEPPGATWPSVHASVCPEATSLLSHRHASQLFSVTPPSKRHAKRHSCDEHSVRASSALASSARLSSLLSLLGSGRLPASWVADVRSLQQQAGLVRSGALRPSSSAIAPRARARPRAVRLLDDTNETEAAEALHLRASAISVILHRLLLGRRRNKGQRPGWSSLPGVLAEMRCSKRLPGSWVALTASECAAKRAAAQAAYRLLLPIETLENQTLDLLDAADRRPDAMPDAGRRGEAGGKAGGKAGGEASGEAGGDACACEGWRRWADAIVRTAAAQCLTERYGGVVQLLISHELP